MNFIKAWVLILVIGPSGPESGNYTPFHNVYGFKSERSCEQAGADIAAMMRTDHLLKKYKCVSTGVEKEVDNENPQ